MDEVAGGVRLVRDPGRLPPPPEVGKLRLDVNLSVRGPDEGVVDAEAALEHARRALGAKPREPRGQQGRRAWPKPGASAWSGSRRRGKRRARRRTSLRSRARSSCARPSAPVMLAAAATPPKMPQIAVGWNPLAWKAPEAAMPTRVTTSFPATIAVSSSRPPAPSASAAAAAAGQTTTLTWAIESEWVSSKSRPWQSIALAKAALGAGSACGKPDHRRLRLPAELRHRGTALGGDAEGVCGEAAPDRVEQVQLGRHDHFGWNVVERQALRPLGDGTCCSLHRTGVCQTGAALSNRAA